MAAVLYELIANQTRALDSITGCPRGHVEIMSGSVNATTGDYTLPVTLTAQDYSQIKISCPPEPAPVSLFIITIFIVAFIGIGVTVFTTIVTRRSMLRASAHKSISDRDTNSNRDSSTSVSSEPIV